MGKRRAEEDLQPYANAKHVASGRDSPSDSPRGTQGLWTGGGERQEAAHGRAATCRQHVRALNEQFARWVEEQMAQRPQELWSEGVSDYEKHASTIMCDFTDVIETRPHLPPPSSPPISSAIPSSYPPPGVFSRLSSSPLTTHIPPPVLPTLSTPSVPFPVFGQPEKKNLSGGQLDEPSPPPLFGSSPLSWPSAPLTDPSKSSCGPSATRSALPLLPSPAPVPRPDAVPRTNPWAALTAPFPPPTTPPLSPAAASSQGISGGWVGGVMASAEGEVAEGEGGEEGDGDDGKSSVQKEVEEGVTVLHEKSYGLYVQSDDKAWKGMGKGTLLLKQYPRAEGEGEGNPPAPRILFRNETGKLLLNALLYAGLEGKVKKKTVLFSLYSHHDVGTNEMPPPGTPKEEVKCKVYLLKASSEAEAEELVQIVAKHTPAKKED